MVPEKSLTWNHTIKPEPKNHPDPSTFITFGSQLNFFWGKMKPFPPEIQHESNPNHFWGSFVNLFFGECRDQKQICIYLNSLCKMCNSLSQNGSAGLIGLALLKNWKMLPKTCRRKSLLGETFSFLLSLFEPPSKSLTNFQPPRSLIANLLKLVLLQNGWKMGWFRGFKKKKTVKPPRFLLFWWCKLGWLLG